MLFLLDKGREGGVDNLLIVYTSYALPDQGRHSPESTFASKSLQILQGAAVSAAYNVHINIGSLRIDPSESV